MTILTMALNCINRMHGDNFDGESWLASSAIADIVCRDQVEARCMEVFLRHITASALQRFTVEGLHLFYNRLGRIGITQGEALELHRKARTFAASLCKGWETISEKELANKIKSGADAQLISRQFEKHPDAIIKIHPGAFSPIIYAIDYRNRRLHHKGQMQLLNLHTHDVLVGREADLQATIQTIQDEMSFPSLKLLAQASLVDAAFNGKYPPVFLANISDSSQVPRHVSDLIGDKLKMHAFGFKEIRCWKDMDTFCDCLVAFRTGLRFADLTFRFPEDPDTSFGYLSAKPTEWREGTGYSLYPVATLEETASGHPLCNSNIQMPLYVRMASEAELDRIQALCSLCEVKILGKPRLQIRDNCF